MKKEEGLSKKKSKGEPLSLIKNSRTRNKEDKGNPLSSIEKEEGLSKKISKGDPLSLIKDSRI